MAADLARGAQAVQFRHLDVHQHQVIVARQHHAHRFGAVERDVHLHARGGHEVEGDFAVVGIVFGQQDARAIQARQFGPAWGPSLARRMRVGIARV